MKLRSGKLFGTDLRQALGDVGYDGEEELPGLSRQEAEELPEDLQQIEEMPEDLQPPIEETPEASMEVVPKDENDEQSEPEGMDVDQSEGNVDEPLVGDYEPPQQRPKPDFGMCKIFVTLVLVVLLTSWMIGIF